MIDEQPFSMKCILNRGLMSRSTAAGQLAAHRLTARFDGSSGPRNTSPYGGRQRTRARAEPLGLAVVVPGVPAIRGRGVAATGQPRHRFSRLFLESLPHGNGPHTLSPFPAPIYHADR